MKPDTLTSSRNPILKSVRRAVAHGELTEDGLCVAEGVHLFDEALRSGCEIASVLVADRAMAGLDERIPALGAVRVQVLPEPLFREISSTETSQGIVSLVRPPQWQAAQLIRERALILVLDGIQDPGNAGAMVRTAEAFGATGVVFLKGTASAYNPKALRASAGSLFRVPCLHRVDDARLREFIESNALPLFAAMPDGVTVLDAADFRKGCAIVMGSEGRGVRTEIARRAVSVRIPTRGVESLNAAVAAGIVLYEAQRQRSAA